MKKVKRETVPSNAFRNIYSVGTGTNSAITKNTNWIYRFDGNAENIQIGTILYCNSLNGTKRGHIGIHIGYYVTVSGTVIEHAVAHFHGGKESGLTIEAIEGSRFSGTDAEYTEYNYLDYNVTYNDTVQYYQ